MCHLLKCGSTRRLLNWQGPLLWTHWRLFKSHHLDWQIKGISHQPLQILFTCSIGQKPTRQRCDKNLWSELGCDRLSSEDLLLLFFFLFFPIDGWYLANCSVSETFLKQTGTLMLTAWGGMFHALHFFVPLDLQSIEKISVVSLKHIFIQHFIWSPHKDASKNRAIRLR